MKTHVKSFGCSANHAEAEIIKGEYKDSLAREEDAEHIVLNICTVKGDGTALREIRAIKEKYPHKKITITGCITQSIVEPIRRIDPHARLVNTHNILQLSSLVNTKTDALHHDKPIKLLKPRVRMNPVVGIVPISSGCLDACSFCSTRLVKGTLFSFPAEQIVREVQQCVADGCKEIWITGQDTCCYGFDRGTNLAELLSKIVDVPGDFFVRVGMGNPRHVPKYLSELVDSMKHPKIFKFLHIPVQAGNNDVLKAMRRGHTVETYVDIVKKMRDALPEMTISTDIIVGYPGETDAQFEDTLQLVRDTAPDCVNNARFAARAGTAAAAMADTPFDIKKARSAKLREVHSAVALERNKRWLNWEGDIIIDEHAKDGMCGRNYAYKPVIVRETLAIGDVVRVRIVDVQSWALIGILL